MRQGFLLSPLLLSIVMKILTNSKVKKKERKGIKIKKEIYHSQRISL
jgi:hypothetical protein